MKVGELIEALKRYDSDMEVLSADVWHDMPRYRMLRHPKLVNLRKVETSQRGEPQFVEPDVKWFGYETPKEKAEDFLLLWVTK